MPASINKVPAGLLGFLGIKNGGENPTQLESQLRTSVDLWPLYQAGYGEIVSAAINVAAAGFPVGGAPFTVPDNQYWWCFEYSIQSNTALGAGQVLQSVPGYVIPSAGANLFFGVGPPSNRATTGLFMSASNSEQFILPPGALLAQNAVEVAAGPVNCTANLRFIRLPS